MGCKLNLLILFLFYVIILLNYNVNAASWPTGFGWGTATASYQVEGSWNVSGRGLSIWDVFSHTPGKTYDGETGDVADESYERYGEDIQLMTIMGVTFARLSLSWSRIYPTGEEPINPLGIDHYNEVIDTLISAGIQPFVTLYHWDLPSDLETNYGGWTNASISDFYTLYAQTVFAAFGDRVKFWLTFNEPLSFCWLGYGAGIHAPGRCTERSICPYGDSATEPYLCAHNVLISHAETVQIYREQFQPTQKGHIGITLNCDWAEPLTNSTADQLAAERNLLFQLGWYADPVWFGDYPAVMKQFVGNRLPEFTPDQQKLLKGSYDFFALNHYTTSYASNCSNPPANLTLGWQTDQRVNLTKTSVNGTLIGPPADSSWLYVVPWGFRKMLNWIWQRYNTPIYVTENGVDVPNESSLPILVALNDTFRVNFYQSYLSNLLAAITEDGVDVRGYMAWSLLDNFEWADGYSKRFGVHYVDYENNLTRYTKLSSNYLRGVINGTINVNLPYSTYFNNVS